MPAREVTILGGGLCGALLAIILARRGLGVTVLERDPDPRERVVTGGRSINLAMAARGIRALEHAGVFDFVEPLMLPMRGRLIHDRDGGTAFHPYGQHEDDCIWSVSRAGLNRVLLDAASRHPNVQLLFEQEAIGFDAAAPTLTMRDRQEGADYEAIVRPLIAADGAGSIVRRAPGSRRRFGSTEERLPHAYRELSVPADASGGFRLDPGALHIWPRGGFMLIALPNPAGDFTLTVFLPEAGANSFAALDSPEDAERFFRDQFPDVCPLIEDFEGSWQRNPRGRLGTIRCRTWHDGGKTLLIGDAAHAIVPFHGQGMNLCFDDCRVLDTVLASTGDDWDAAFAAFESAQRANADAIADMALENYVEMRDTVRDPAHLLKRELAFALESRLPDRFVPRYSMVMFRPDISYADAQARGEIQSRLLDELAARAATLDDVDLDQAEQRVCEELEPLG